MASDRRIRFKEQLDAIGRTLSYRHHQHPRAVKVFRLAVQLDPEHAYAHHYLAYNLDWLAENTEALESHYRRAIDLQPTHPWFWSRWICYLATRGRGAEAKAQWHEAVCRAQHQRGRHAGLDFPGPPPLGCPMASALGRARFRRDGPPRNPRAGGEVRREHSGSLLAPGVAQARGAGQVGLPAECATAGVAFARAAHRPASVVAGCSPPLLDPGATWKASIEKTGSPSCSRRSFHAPPGILTSGYFETELRRGQVEASASGFT